MRKIFASLMLAVLFSGCKEKPAPAPTPQVQFITVTPTNVPIYQQWIGTLNGYPNAQIRAQVTGYLTKQDYAEGSAVRQGQLLFEIDPRPFQAALDQALARQAQDEAQQGKTKEDVKRYKPLAKEQAISQQELDDAVQADLGAAAAIKADEAAVETARLNLGFCRIISPIDGIAGIATAQIGDLVSPGGAVLTTVSTIDPMRVYFNISEQSYLAFAEQFTNTPERTTYRKDMALQLILSDGATYSRPGKWLFTDRQVNANTGTIQIAGQFPNPDNILRPGQYGQVRAKVETRQNALLVPQRAVTELQGSYQITIVDSDSKVHIKNVQVGSQVGSDWVIDKGLEANDRVVIEGAAKVKEGTVVDPQPYGQATTNSVSPDKKE